MVLLYSVQLYENNTDVGILIPAFSVSILPLYYTGIFSEDLSTLLVERGDNPVSVYRTADLTKVDVSATTG